VRTLPWWAERLAVTRAVTVWEVPARSVGVRQVPARTAQSDQMSKDLGKRGFKFVGSTICYAFMQAVGMVNDHVVDCFRYRAIMSGKSGGVP